MNQATHYRLPREGFEKLVRIPALLAASTEPAAREAKALAEEAQGMAEPVQAEADTDTFGPQSQQELTTEQVRALLETYEKAYWNLGEAMDSREPTPEHPGLVMTDWQRARQRQYQDALGAVGKAFPTLARDLLAEREAHAATRAEADRLRAALAEAEALASEWLAEATQDGPVDHESYEAADAARAAQFDCACELTKALATSQEGLSMEEILRTEEVLYIVQEAPK